MSQALSSVLRYSVQRDMSSVSRKLGVWQREITIIRPSKPSRGGGGIGAGGCGNTLGWHKQTEGSQEAWSHEQEWSNKEEGNRLQAVGMSYGMQTRKGTGLFQEKPVIHCDCSQERKVAELRRGWAGAGSWWNHINVIWTWPLTQSKWTCPY